MAIKRFFLDTEFLEGEQTLYQWGMQTDYWLRLFAIIFYVLMVLLNWYFLPTFLLEIVIAICFIISYFFFSISISKSPNTIDLVSIGIFSDDGRTYYSISKDFNLKEAWNRWEQRTGEGDRNNIEPRLYWIRDNVLKSIWEELEYKEYRADFNDVKDDYIKILDSIPEKDRVIFYFDIMLADDFGYDVEFTYKRLKYLINKFGKSNKTIAKEIQEFVYGFSIEGLDSYTDILEKDFSKENSVEFYGYYCDYDWVVFCWLFGKMIDLPKGFPEYCIDTKQMLDYKATKLGKAIARQAGAIYSNEYFDTALKSLKCSDAGYPINDGNHNALSDAEFVFNLYRYLNCIKS